MNRPSYSRRYATLHDEELLRLKEQKSSLTEDAQIALSAELEKRGLASIRPAECSPKADTQPVRCYWCGSWDPSGVQDSFVFGRRIREEGVVVTYGAFRLVTAGVCRNCISSRKEESKSKAGAAVLLAAAALVILSFVIYCMIGNGDFFDRLDSFFLNHQLLGLLGLVGVPALVLCGLELLFGATTSHIVRCAAQDKALAEDETLKISWTLDNFEKDMQRQHGWTETVEEIRKVRESHGSRSRSG